MPVYFMQPAEGGPVKIGHSGDVEARRIELEAYYRCPLAVLATMPGGREEEAAIHSRFARLRLGRTEQFRPDPELMEFIGRPLPPGVDPDAVQAMPWAVTQKGSAIRAAREALRFTRKEVGNALGLGEQFLYQIETGRRAPPLRTLWDIAVYLKINPNSLDHRLASRPKGGEGR